MVSMLAVFESLIGSESALHSCGLAVYRVNSLPTLLLSKSVEQTGKWGSVFNMSMTSQGIADREPLSWIICAYFILITYC